MIAEAFLHLFPSAAVIFYLLATYCYLRLLARTERASLTRWGRLFLQAGLSLHVVFLFIESFGYFRAHHASVKLLTLPFSLSITSVVVVLLFLFLEKRFQASVLGGFVSPLGLVVMLISSVLFHLPSHQGGVSGNGILLWIHVLATLLANAIFVFAFSVSVAVIIQESLLKERKLSFLQWKFPALQDLDLLNEKLLTSGFFLMLLGVSAGLLFSYFQRINLFQYDSRVIWSLITLSVYALLLIARMHRGWRGRRAAWLAVAGFSTLVASFVGVYLLGGAFHSY